ncbi:MAG: GNAT family N-acetyltransferase [Chloroflexota bacterium]|nr:GNAT family N-acetyltransferase [Anaerolineae bacterium]HMM28360.1 GNAT family N-acetyltransferase [Aggregatilineaceae bacterium]
MTLLSTEVRAARPVDLPGMSAVLEDAFSDKMRVIFSHKPHEVRAVLEALYQGPVARGYDGILVAERAGRIIGTLLIEPMQYTAAELSAFERASVRELGLLRTLRASFMLWVSGLDHKPDLADAHISDLGVARDCRGEGVATLLLERAEAWTRERRRARLTLWVAANNAAALHLYEKAGFTIARTRRSVLTRLFFGIAHWHLMEKRLVEPPF